MHPSIWQSIAATPWWVLPVCVYFIWSCYAATKPRLVPIQRIYWLPSLIFGLSIMNLVLQIQYVHPIHLCLWGASLFLGLGLGYLQLTLSKIKAVKNSPFLLFPGSWLLLVTLSIFGMMAYFFSLPFTISLDFFTNHEHIMRTAFLSGLISGLLLGRIGWIFHCMRFGPFAQLGEQP